MGAAVVIDAPQTHTKLYTIMVWHVVQGGRIRLTTSCEDPVPVAPADSQEATTDFFNACAQWKSYNVAGHL